MMVPTTVEQRVQQQLGSLMLQILMLQTEVEQLRMQLAPKDTDHSGPWGTKAETIPP